MTTSIPLGWGCIKSTPQTRDPRDYKYVPHPLTVALNPASTNWNALLGTWQVPNQGGCGDCCGYSTRNLWWVYSTINGFSPNTDVSGEFLYYESVIQYNPAPTCAMGTQLFNTLKGAANTGLCAQSFNCSPTSAPTPAMLTDAKTRHIVQYQNLFYEATQQGIDAKSLIQTALANRQCVVAGIDVYASFRNGQSDIFPPTGSYVGGHALCLVDYDDWGVYGPNSWGTGWGCARAKRPGWFSLPWAFVQSQYFNDTWTITGVQAVGVTQGPLPVPPIPSPPKATPMINIIGGQFQIVNGNNPTGTVTVSMHYSGDTNNIAADATPLILDAKTGQPAPQPVVTMSTIDASGNPLDPATGAPYSVKAVPPAPVAYVNFYVDGSSSVYRKEGYPPYDLFGDTFTPTNPNGVYNVSKLGAGSHTVKANGCDSSGNVLSTGSITFTET